MKQIVEDHLQIIRTLESDPEFFRTIEKSINFIQDSIQLGNKLLICGNGGSAGDAQHMAGEFLCRFYFDRNPLPAIALTTDTSTITAIANDYSYDEVFSRQVTALGKSGDVLLGITTSGNSRNIELAFEVAKENEIATLLLSGKTGGRLKEMADLSILIPSTETPRIQEFHIMVEHYICQEIEKRFFG